MNPQIIPILLLLLLSPPAFSQEVEMLTDWSEATSLAEKEDKQILIILTGSEWCAPCKKMDKNVIAHPDFQQYAQQNLIVFLIDLPGGAVFIYSKVYQDYEAFKKRYQTMALPSLILTQSDGTKIRNLDGKMFKLENVMKQLTAR